MLNTHLLINVVQNIIDVLMEHTFVQYHTKKLAPLKYPFRGDREESGFVKLKVGGGQAESETPVYNPPRRSKTDLQTFENHQTPESNPFANVNLFN